MRGSSGTGISYITIFKVHTKAKARVVADYGGNVADIRFFVIVAIFRASPSHVTAVTDQLTRVGNSWLAIVGRQPTSAELGDPEYYI